MIEVETGANFLVEGKIVRLNFAEITHIGLVAGVTAIYTRNKKYRSDNDLSELLNRLPRGQFMRVHREFAVAPAHVDRVENYKVCIGRHRLVINFFYRTRLLAALETLETTN